MELNGFILILLSDRVIHIRGMILLTKNRFIHIIGRKRRNSFLGILHYCVMVATVRCEEIANEKFRQLTCDEVWLELEEAVQAGPVPGFGKKLSSILENYLFA
ncbi:hypothetical protein UlMin_041812 [Ulmus minor]